MNFPNFQVIFIQEFITLISLMPIYTFYDHLFVIKTTSKHRTTVNLDLSSTIQTKTDVRGQRHNGRIWFLYSKVFRFTADKTIKYMFLQFLRYIYICPLYIYHDSS